MSDRAIGKVVRSIRLLTYKTMKQFMTALSKKLNFGNSNPFRCRRIYTPIYGPSWSVLLYIIYYSTVTSVSF